MSRSGSTLTINQTIAKKAIKMAIKIRNKNIRILVWVVGAMCAIIAFVAGFGSKIAKIDHCVARVDRYVTAEYSAVTVTPCFNGDGSLSTCVETDYWSEPASEVFSITTQDGVAMPSNLKSTEIHHGVYFPPMPPRWDDVKKGSDFDGFKQHTDTGLRVFNTDFGNENQDSFREPISKHTKCLDTIGDFVSIKTWYGSTYSSEF